MFVKGLVGKVVKVNNPKSFDMKIEAADFTDKDFEAMYWEKDTTEAFVLQLMPMYPQFKFASVGRGDLYAISVS